MVSMRHLPFFFMCDYILMKAKIITSSYHGLLTELALLVECLAPGQNCIACILRMVKFLGKGEKTRVLNKNNNELFVVTTMCDLNLIQGKIKSSSYGPLAEIAF